MLAKKKTHPSFITFSHLNIGNFNLGKSNYDSKRNYDTIGDITDTVINRYSQCNIVRFIVVSLRTMT